MTRIVLQWSEPLPQGLGRPCLHAVVERPSSESTSYVTACGGRWNPGSSMTTDYIENIRERFACAACWAYAIAQPAPTIGDLIAHRVTSLLRAHVLNYENALLQYATAETINTFRAMTYPLQPARQGCAPSTTTKEGTNADG